MNNEIKEFLDKIEEDKKQYGDSIFTKNKKADDKEIEHFKKWIVKYLKKSFPEYIDFIKSINGFEYNGLKIYTLNKDSEYNIYNSNEEWWYDNEEQQEYIFFGNDDISWYCLNKNNEKYYVLDLPSGNEMDEYETFDEIIIKALKVSLYMDDE